MKWNVFFGKIIINLQQFQVAPENKTQGNFQTNLISRIKKKKQAKLEVKDLGWINLYVVSKDKCSNDHKRGISTGNLSVINRA